MKTTVNNENKDTNNAVNIGHGIMSAKEIMKKRGVFQATYLLNIKMHRKRRENNVRTKRAQCKANLKMVANKTIACFSNDNSKATDVVKIWENFAGIKIYNKQTDNQALLAMNKMKLLFKLHGKTIFYHALFADNSANFMCALESIGKLVTGTLQKHGVDTLEHFLSGQLSALMRKSPEQQKILMEDLQSIMNPIHRINKNVVPSALRLAETKILAEFNKVEDGEAINTKLRNSYILLLRKIGTGYVNSASSGPTSMWLIKNKLSI